MKVSKAAWLKKARELVQQSKLDLANGEKQSRGDPVRHHTERSFRAEQLRAEERWKAAREIQRVSMAQCRRKRISTAPKGVEEFEMPHGKDECNDTAFRA